MKVPFIELSQSTQRVKGKYIERISGFLDRANFILSPEVEQFENEWAAYVGTEHCVGVSSGADALYLALVSLGVGPGDEVITQGTAYNASVTAILRVGAVPRFADVDPDTLTVAPALIEQLITDKTKAIMPVHLYGQAADMESIMSIAAKYNVVVVEDCAQAHGAAYNGRRVGSWGDAGAFSFYPTKNLGAFGDAGAVTMSSVSVRDEIRARRNLGQIAKNEHRYFGTNMRLDGLQAIALSLKLPYLSDEIRERQTLAEQYDKLIADAKLPLKPVSHLPGATHVYHLYVVQSLSMQRAELCRRMAEQGIGTAVHYPVPIYSQPFYQGPADACPVSDAVCVRILSLPLYPGLTQSQQKHVVYALSEIMKKYVTV